MTKEDAKPQRDERGWWLPGQSANPAGRPRTGIDFKRVIFETAERENFSLEHATWCVFQSMLKRAIEGDTNAAKLVLDRICLPETMHVELKAGETGTPRLPTGAELSDYLDRFFSAAKQQGLLKVEVTPVEDDES